MPRRLSLIASLALLPALAACGGTAPEAIEPPLGKEALAAVTDTPGAPREQLARAVDSVFTEEGLGETRAVIVMHAGKIAAERYSEGFGPDTRFLGWSMAKSVTAVAIGILVAEGKLRLDESPPITHWQRPGDPRGEITLRQLLQMRSGLRHTETSDPPYKADTVRLLFLDGRDDMAREAEAQPLEAEPGQQFEYSTANSLILADIMARVLSPSRNPAARQAAVDHFLQDRLFGPLALDSMTAEYDAAGTMIGGAMIHATARDWARFGEFLRHGGSVKGAQIVPRGWIAFMRRPSPRASDYGAGLWLNRASGSERRVLFPDQGPSSLFGMAGHFGQYVLVSPSQKLTIVRLGRTGEEERPALVAALARIAALYPES
ncbi:serine hydrolase [Croceicoccus estronivorus]|uniref:serine hydrolase domain-containing protein n=1 Tax=Croceicoccus estronivorus TaxID=1172626 RepID=UPI000830F4F3|nr:serine hydrolase [Croceicoccus estronivorus]OCC24037.1 serine hydrolase [Croceicoccus estronivorus]